MELVYLWVEEYKNIKNQGFNFSPRFECEFKAEYDEDGKLENDYELKITPKDYMNIFPENINITAIVGENGSGKSRILNMIKQSEGIKIIVFHENRKIYYISNNKIHIKYIPNEEINKNYFEDSMLLSWDFLGNSSLANYFIENLYKKEDYDPDFNVDENIFFSETIFSLITFNHNILLFIFEYDKKEHKPLFNFCPSKIFFQIKNISKLLLEDRSNEEKNIITDINNKIDALYTKFTEVQDEDIYYIKENIKEYFLLFLCKKFENKIKFSNIKNINELENYFKDTYIFIGDMINDLNSFELELSIFNFDPFIFSEHYSIFEFEKLYLDKEETLKKLLTLEFIELNYENENGIKLLDLSQGERTIFLQSLLIDSWICKTEGDSLFLLFDEIDISLHPNWQKKQVQELINLLSQYEKKFHLILTSHSPFILSDLLKENVIFLDKVNDKTEEKYPKLDIKGLENGNCINVSKYIELKTFGANIHTLLSNGFFMSDGLMGEFAKSKINEAIDNLHGKSQSLSQKQIKSIIDSIGEPFLQIKLEQMYKEKFGLDDEIEELEKRQEEINLKIKQLKKQKSENAKS